MAGYQKLGSAVSVGTARGYFEEPSVSIDSDGLINGDYVVTWSEYTGGLDGPYSLKAQLLSGTGTKTGAPLLIDTANEQLQVHSTVSGLAGGGFVVSWADFDGVEARLFDANGAAAGSSFLVNSVSPYIQSDPVVSALSDGGFVVSWGEYLGDTPGFSSSAVLAQRFDNMGVALGTPIIVDDKPAATHGALVAGLDNGGFVASWIEGSGSGRLAQTFDGQGNETSGEVVVAADTFETASIAGLANGGFVVSWEDFNPGNGSHLRSQVYQDDGSVVGPVILNETSEQGHYDPTLTALSNGAFALSWADPGTFGMNDGGVKVQVYAADGGLVGGTSRVAAAGGLLSTGALADGGFEVSYASVGSIINGDGALAANIKSQIYVTNGAIISNHPPALTGAQVILPHAVINTPTTVTAAELLTGFTDQDGDTLSITSIFSQSGVTDNHDGTYTLGGYPYSTSYRVSYTVSDSHGGAAPAVLYVSVDWPPNSITGTDGPDRIVGTYAPDLISGLAGGDTLIGGSREDILIGGAGRDILYGGEYADVFRYLEASDSLPGAANRDVIRDYEVGYDRIDLTALSPQVHQVDAYTGGLFEVKQHLNGTGWDLLSIDLNGDQRTDMQIYVHTGGQLLSDADFVL